MLPVRDITQFASPKRLKDHPRVSNTKIVTHLSMGEWESRGHSVMGSVLGENPNPKGELPITEPQLRGKKFQEVSARGIVVCTPQPR